MLSETEKNELRTKEADYNLRIARKNGKVVICQTTEGNVQVTYYETPKIYVIQSWARIEAGQIIEGRELARGKRSDVIETLKSLFVIVEE
jgi:hypothetical protein